MVTNKYFKPGVKSEQNLYEDLIIESIKMYGQNVYYLPRTIVNKDPILLDDVPSSFTSAYQVEMYIENVDGFPGEGHLFSKFGVEIRDQATFIVARSRWKDTVSDYDNNIQGDLPAEGDLIYLPLSKSLFQIMLVEREQPFYQLSNLVTIRLECELFEYNDEALDTGIEEIDDIEQLGYELKLTFDSDSDAITVTEGETLAQTLADGTIIRGEVFEWDRARQIASVGHIRATDGDLHLFSVGGTVTSNKTAATRIIRGVSEDLGDHQIQNQNFDSTVDAFLDFTEDNPFGTPE